MEPAEVALVVDGQAFQKVCLETGVGVRPPVHTWAATRPALRCSATRRPVYQVISLSAHSTVCGCGGGHTGARGIVVLYQSGPLTRHGCNTSTCSLAPQPRSFLKLNSPWAQQCVPVIPNTHDAKAGGLLQVQNLPKLQSDAHPKHTNKQSNNETEGGWRHMPQCQHLGDGASLKLVWSTEQVPGLLELQRGPVSGKEGVNERIFQEMVTVTTHCPSLSRSRRGPFSLRLLTVITRPYLKKVRVD